LTGSLEIKLQTHVLNHSVTFKQSKYVSIELQFCTARDIATKAVWCKQNGSKRQTNAAN